MPDDLITIRLDRDGEDWHASARRGGAELAAAGADSPGHALELIGQTLDQLEVDRLDDRVLLTAEERRALADVADVLEALERAAEGPTASRAEPGSLTALAIAEHTGYAVPRVIRALDTATADGAVVRVEDRPARWRLSMEAQSEGGER